MTKRVFRSISLLMSILLLCSLTPIVNASTVSDDTDVIDIGELSSDTINMLQELGVVLDEESVIQLTPLKEEAAQSRAEAEKTLSITNVNGNQAITDTILVFNENGTVPIKKSDSLTRAGIIWSYDGSGKIVVNSTAAYNQYTEGNIIKEYYSQPIGVSFKYTKIDSAAQVQNITVRYYCAGEVYSYPGLVDQGYSDAHVVSVSQNSPQPSTHYGKTQQYNTSRAMWVNGLYAIMPGQYIYCEATVNGSKFSGSSPTQNY